jgi:hypothetical protein
MRRRRKRWAVLLYKVLDWHFGGLGARGAGTLFKA